ncbi:MAG: DNA glycosylase [Methanosarcinales archaeon Met12]|nr:MAG: DNA glycosylase [Methanosarcinales archaeon Met12]
MKTYQIPVPTFDLDHTLRCGQVFRWRENKEEWTGIVLNSIVRARQRGDMLVIESDLSKKDIINYFRLDDDLENIYKHIGKDKLMKKIIARYNGLRLIRQDSWECLVSYICSINNRIPQIESMIQNLCTQFGDDIGGAYGFPCPERIYKASQSELKKCKLGFRERWIRGVAKKVYDDRLQLSQLKNLDYQSAKKTLMGVEGVGHKVADCVLLFSLDKLEAFPIDVHIRRFMRREYFQNKVVSDEKIRELARGYFGKYAGYAQEYLFYYERSESRK